jgi:hypothetical protein
MMALETLKGISKIGGYDVVVMDELRKKHPKHFNESGSMDYQWFEKEIRPKNFVYVRHDKNSLAFTLQNGPVKENGVNGCQVDTLIHAAMAMIMGLNENYPCKENDEAIDYLGDAIMSLRARTADREKRGVEGTSNE